MFADLIWLLILVVLAGLTGWLVVRSWKSPRGRMKWPGTVFSGIATLLILVILMLGFLPIPPDVAPIPTPGHIGAPDNAPTIPLVTGAPRTLTVHPGQTIQSAVDQAKPGDIVEVAAGVYHEAVKVNTDDLTLRGIPDSTGQWPVLDGQGKLDNAVMGSGNFLIVEQFQISNYTNNGVIIKGAYGSTYRDLIITDPGQYGVFPVLDTHVIIQRIKVTGAKDAGIYVGQSRDILVEDSEAFKNNSGIEIESSINSVVQNNYVHDNTLGMLVWISEEPDVIAKDGHDAKLLNNRVENNNASPIATYTLPGAIPPGIGILVLMADRTEVAHNTIKNNNSAGVAVAQASTAFGDTHTFTVPLIPDGTWLHDNLYLGNGTQPAGFITQAGFPGADILWDASSWDSRFDDTNVKTFPLLPSSAWPDLAKRALWQIYRLLLAGSPAAIGH
jgi:cytochrome c peroxidase